MLEETSTSSSAAAGASPDDLYRSPPAVGSTGDSSTSATAQALHFSSGNPRIEEIRGVMHLYRDDVASSSAQFPVERKPLISVLGVPNHMTYADFCKFCGSFIQHMLEMRIVRTEGLEDRYSILIRFDNQTSADSFYKHFNGKRFSSLERDWTKIQVEFLTTICNHSFHCSCISRWTDSSCPYVGIASNSLRNQYVMLARLQKIFGCVSYVALLAVGGTGKDMPLVIGKKHNTAILLNWKRSEWDYAGDNYVHRLIQSKTDGKLVELNHHCMPNGDGYSDTLLESEVEYIVNEYNELLTSQLENQKNYFESLLQEVEDDTERESSVAVEKALSQNPKLLKLQAKLDKFIEEKRFLDDINENLLRNQGIWESKIAEIEEREKKLLKLKDEKIEELEEQLRVMMVSLETGSAEQSFNKLKEVNILPLVAESSSSKNGSKGSRKTTNRRKNKG
ncbi:UNVERIFIED_CONTAM: BRAP2 RING ZnF UBP domain-containing protein 2 [Sesamum radiatum]|uniref:BRAP2 RING ZnF UBP domain-containing protein 2 n=1 Tax=Sesamum radiatum TaxID=300843 RepID=A0AAW2VKZ3_SESRA